MENSPDQLENLSFLKGLIGKSVRIETIDKEIHEGKIYVIDPITKTAVLSRDTSICIITFPSIKTFEVTSEDVTNYTEPTLVRSDIDYRKSRLKNWLRKNRIEVKEFGSILKIQDEVEIGPPYTIDQCRCSNKIILERIVCIIERMSENNELNS